MFLLLPFCALHIIMQTSCHSPGQDKTPPLIPQVSPVLSTRIFTTQLSIEHLHLEGLQPSHAKYTPNWTLDHSAFPPENYSHGLSLSANDTTNHLAAQARNLGVILATSLFLFSYTQSVTSLVDSTKSLLCPFNSISTASALVLATILSHADYKPQPLTSLYF